MACAGRRATRNKNSHARAAKPHATRTQNQNDVYCVRSSFTLEFFWSWFMSCLVSLVHLLNIQRARVISETTQRCTAYDSRLMDIRLMDIRHHLLSDLLHLTNTIIAVRKDIRPEETFTFRSPTLNKHNHCSPQRHTILLFDFLLSSWPQSAKTYDLKKHLLADLLHLTNTTIAVRKDVQYCF